MNIGQKRSSLKAVSVLDAVRVMSLLERNSTAHLMPSPEVDVNIFVYVRRTDKHRGFI